MKQIQTKLFDLDKVEWLDNLFNDRNEPNGNKLRTYRKYKNVLCISTYVKMFLIDNIDVFYQILEMAVYH